MLCVRKILGQYFTNRHSRSGRTGINPATDMKTIIAGSRTINSPVPVCEAMNESGFTITEVVSGGARGADLYGELLARHNGIPIKRFTAEWNRLGKGAGCIRNNQMAEYADALIAVWDGKSKGTAHMIRAAGSKGLKVYVKIL